jgi:hypothetical protein
MRKRLKFEHSHKTHTMDNMQQYNLNILQCNLNMLENIQGLHLHHSIVRI